MKRGSAQWTTTKKKEEEEGIDEMKYLPRWNRENEREMMAWKEKNEICCKTMSSQDTIDNKNGIHIGATVVATVWNVDEEYAQSGRRNDYMNGKVTMKMNGRK